MSNKTYITIESKIYKFSFIFLRAT